jgi:hydroxyacylglutathione hydrolase
VTPKPTLIPPLVVGPFGVNCWLVAGEGRQALVIDPGDDADRILERLKRLDLIPALYLLTHGHADHVGALEALLSVYPADVLMHSADAAWAFTADNAIPPYYPPLSGPPDRLRTVQAPFPANEEAAGLTFKIIATPGHTPGGLCFYFPETGRLFTGDTLFAGTVGRTDLPGGNEAVLAQSLKQLTGLPGDTLIHPGHGESSTLTEELRTNPFMKT